MDLSDKEQFLLHYLKNRQIKWGIDEPVKNLFGHCGRVIQDLKYAGYLIDDDHSYFLETESVTELKNILEKLHLPKTGKKSELIERIKSHTSVAERKGICSDLYYVLTEKGISEEKKYWEQKKSSDIALKAEVFLEIANGNYIKSAQAMGEVYSKMPIPPGIGIDWNDTAGIELRATAELESIKKYDFSDLENSSSFKETFLKIVYYDNTINHNLQSSISQFMDLLNERIQCKNLDIFFQEKLYLPSESQKLFAYLSTKRYNAFQNNMRRLLKKDAYRPLPEGTFNISDSTIKFWKDYKFYELLLSKNIEGFPKTYQTYEKHRNSNSDKYQFWVSHL